MTWHGNGSADHRLLANQRGLTSLEGAVVFTGFVLLAAGFIFVVLNTGILSSTKSGTAIRQGLQQLTGNLKLAGPVIGEANVEETAIFRIIFQVTNLDRELKGVDLSRGSASITYIDEDQLINLSPFDWTATWLTGSGTVLNAGERVEINVDLRSLNPPLGASRQFTLQVVPLRGTTLTITRKTPTQFEETVNLS